MMKNPLIKAGLLLFCGLISPGTVHADSQPGQSPDITPFKPHWEFELGLTSSGTPGDKGGGQNANDLTFGATREFSESGNFLTLEGMGGSQRLEGSASKYGSLSFSGGLGLDFFLPTLSLAFQTGDAAFFAATTGLNLGFQIFDDFSFAVNFSGGLSSHQLPLSALNPSLPNTLVELDSKNFGGGLSFIWATSEIFSLSLSGQTTDEITDQIQNLKHTAKVAILNQNSVMPSTSLGFTWAFLKDFTLNGSVQRSEEIEPAGSSYSPSLGEVVYNDTATTLYFSGYSIGLTYNFQ